MNHKQVQDLYRAGPRDIVLLSMRLVVQKLLVKIIKPPHGFDTHLDHFGITLKVLGLKVSVTTHCKNNMVGLFQHPPPMLIGLQCF